MSALRKILDRLHAHCSEFNDAAMGCAMLLTREDRCRCEQQAKSLDQMALYSIDRVADAAMGKSSPEHVRDLMARRGDLSRFIGDECERLAYETIRDMPKHDLHVSRSNIESLLAEKQTADVLRSRGWTVIPPGSAPAQPAGCVCPADAPANCQAVTCPRKNPFAATVR